MFVAALQSPLGHLIVVSNGSHLTDAYFDQDLPQTAIPRPEQPCLRKTLLQLEQYFSGDRREFDLPLAPGGTPFQQRVWSELCKIPYGATTSYGQLAKNLGQPTAARAVGLANGRNPISIIIPCHRVIGADGSLTGYAGGLERKRALLDLERF